MLSVLSWIGISFGALIGLYIIFRLIRWYAQGGQFRMPWIHIDGKVIIVTGCNTGIGKETVMELAKRGARIYMACRDSRKCEKSRVEIVQETGNRMVFNRSLDLSSMKSIRAFVREFLSEESRLDILINNAGVMFTPYTQTEDGFEMQMGTNHLGHFLLTNLLMDTLKASAPSRIINVSSNGHLVGKINREDFQMSKNYNRVLAYGNSKLANILFTRELSKRLHGTGVTANTLHPGAVNTELQRYNPIIKLLFSPALLFFKTPKAGAQTTLMLALDPRFDKISGNYYSDCQLDNESAAARDDDTAGWLWNFSEDLTGLRQSVVKPQNGENGTIL